MTVIKRDRNASSADLIDAIEKFADMLSDQGEDEAVEALNKIKNGLKTVAVGTPAHQKLLTQLVDAFEGDHELNSYIIAKPSSSEWTEADALSQAATRVLNLVRRLRS